MVTKSEQLKAAAQRWRDYAATCDELAESNSDIESGKVQRRKAETALRAAQSLEMELKHGEPYCACCLKPIKDHEKRPYIACHAAGIQRNRRIES